MANKSISSFLPVKRHKSMGNAEGSQDMIQRTRSNSPTRSLSNSPHQSFSRNRSESLSAAEDVYTFSSSLHARLMNLVKEEDGEGFFVVLEDIPVELIDPLSRLVVDTALATGVYTELIDIVVKREMDQAGESSSTLFRVDSFATKVIKQFCHALLGGSIRKRIGPWLKKFLKRGKRVQYSQAPSRTTSASPVSIESPGDGLPTIFPEDGELLPFQNLLLDGSKAILVELTAVLNLSTDSTFGEIIGTIHSRVEKMFKNESKKLVISILFLRFLCPSIINAKAHFQLRYNDPRQNRLLIDLSKILQCYANETEPQADHLIPILKYLRAAEAIVLPFEASVEQLWARESFLQRVTTPDAHALFPALGDLDGDTDLETMMSISPPLGNSGEPDMERNTSRSMSPHAPLDEDGTEVVGDDGKLISVRRRKSSRSDQGGSDRGSRRRKKKKPSGLRTESMEVGEFVDTPKGIAKLTDPMGEEELQDMTRNLMGFAGTVVAVPDLPHPDAPHVDVSDPDSKPLAGGGERSEKKVRRKRSKLADVQWDSGAAMASTGSEGGGGPSSHLISAPEEKEDGEHAGKATLSTGLVAATPAAQTSAGAGQPAGDSVLGTDASEVDEGGAGTAAAAASGIHAPKAAPGEKKKKDKKKKDKSKASSSGGTDETPNSEPAATAIRKETSETKTAEYEGGAEAAAASGSDAVEPETTRKKKTSKKKDTSKGAVRGAVVDESGEVGPVEAGTTTPEGNEEAASGSGVPEDVAVTDAVPADVVDVTLADDPDAVQQETSRKKKSSKKKKGKSKGAEDGSAVDDSGEIGPVEAGGATPEMNEDAAAGSGVPEDGAVTDAVPAGVVDGTLADDPEVVQPETSRKKKSSKKKKCKSKEAEGEPALDDSVEVVPVEAGTTTPEGNEEAASGSGVPEDVAVTDAVPAGVVDVTLADDPDAVQQETSRKKKSSKKKKGKSKGAEDGSAVDDSGEIGPVEAGGATPEMNEDAAAGSGVPEDGAVTDAVPAGVVDGTLADDPEVVQPETSRKKKSSKKKKCKSKEAEGEPALDDSVEVVPVEAGTTTPEGNEEAASGSGAPEDVAVTDAVPAGVVDVTLADDPDAVQQETSRKKKSSKKKKGKSKGAEDGSAVDDSGEIGPVEAGGATPEMNEDAAAGSGVPEDGAVTDAVPAGVVDGTLADDPEVVQPETIRKKKSSKKKKGEEVSGGCTEAAEPGDQTKKSKKKKKTAAAAVRPEEGACADSSGKEDVCSDAGEKDEAADGAGCTETAGDGGSGAALAKSGGEVAPGKKGGKKKKSSKSKEPAE
eukprot:CAMPEP_0119157362 /NCGR_PEP_ID=MMETSP1310-20130426/52717_1 /TAXON_ID=464262 /ORGANISM="Genus nov. species nov., Strain RCC2339" /LENGTH=1300 /DNA_ID=CAMNT_0007149979 /DNA_START=58 /DNA_END=3960 /DNA_ORIENTATION=-